MNQRNMKTNHVLKIGIFDGYFQQISSYFNKNHLISVIEYISQKHMYSTQVEHRSKSNYACKLPC